MHKSSHDDRGNLVNYYDIMNVPRDADKAAIRSSFCVLIKRYHPDSSGENSLDYRKKAELLIKGYKVLIDDALREEYDRLLFSVQRESPHGFVFLPRKRVKYSISLEGLLKTRLLNKSIRRGERVRKFGQDVEIFITAVEAKKGIIAYVDLPTRVLCPLCTGSDRDCHVCRGVGRIASTTMLQVSLPPPIKDGAKIEFDLLAARPDKLTSFTMKTLRVKVTMIGARGAQ
ncbi:MAG: hypothetical protein EPN93_05000 [Spirochaetes bacterium]|nr:MAG: hypothetical protein EPN93_05000 [Spirochaetota bacterium]